MTRACKWALAGLAATLALFGSVVVPAQAATVGGIVPDLPTGAHQQLRPTARAATALPYGGGPVLHFNRTHLIFWQPAGSGLSFEPGYESLIETFLTQVADDSHGPTNVYGLSGQYTDAVGPAAYNSSYGGAVVATDPLPPSSCLEPPLTGPGWLKCVDDGDIRQEIAHVVGVNNLPTGPGDVYFLLTPYGLGSCVGSGPGECALGGGASGSYCGYHSVTSNGNILYAVIPYNGVTGHCQSDNPRPNSSAADPTISTVSHEHNEMVTDPLGNAWIDSAGAETGDLCATQFGPALEGSGPSAYNELIHGGRYWLQEEWSNDDGSCQPRDEADSLSFAAPTQAAIGKSISFTARGRDPDGSIVAYNWYFGDDGSGHHPTSSHTFKRAGVYRVVLRSTDSADSWAFATATIRIGANTPGQAPRQP